MKKRHKGMTVTRTTLSKGLTFKQAAAAMTRLFGGDWRGLYYDKKTGRASIC